MREPATPRVARVLLMIVVGYALSPIDLIPDFVPLLGDLDDALLLPGLIWLALRLIPAPVLAANRRRAEIGDALKPGLPSGASSRVAEEPLGCIAGGACLGRQRGGARLVAAVASAVELASCWATHS
jgi:uncharacterized membrane protein YkvA (DUF1232 family)